MLLEVQGPRELSPLEEEAVNLVFNRIGRQTIRPWELRLEIVESLRLGEQGGRNISQEMATPAKQGSPVGQQMSEKRVTWGEMKKFLQKTTWGGMKQFGVEVASTYESGGKITISGSAFPYTQALNKNSTRRWVDSEAKYSDKELTERFRPGNMHYLSTLIYQCARHWQWTYRRRDDYRPGWGPPYHFTKEQLTAGNRPAISGERHASAAQIYFLIAWQLRYRLSPSPIVDGKTEVPYVDLTSQPPDSEHSVGPVDRYDLIAGKDPDENGQLIVRYQDAVELKAPFSAYETELHNPGQEERYVCAESTQRSRVTERHKFYKRLSPDRDAPDCPIR